MSCALMRLFLIPKVRKAAQSLDRILISWAVTPNNAPNETPAVGTLREAVRFDFGNELIGGQKW